MSKSLPPHTHFPSHTLNATYKAIHLQRSRWEVSSVFTVCLSDLWEEKKQGFIEAQCGPLVTSRGSAGALQRFFFLFFFAPSACCSVLCCPSVHTQSGLFTVKSAADLRKILHTEVASKGCRAPFGEADGLPC